MSSESPLSAALDPLAQDLGSRMKQPFYLSLVIAFLGWNWQNILLLLYPNGDMTLLARIIYVKQSYFIQPWHGFWQYAGWPFLAALIAATVTPWLIALLNNELDRAAVWRQNRRDLAHDKLRPNQKTIADFRAIVDDAKGIASQAIENVERFKQENTALNSQIQSTEGERRRNLEAVVELQWVRDILEERNPFTLTIGVKEKFSRELPLLTAMGLLLDEGY